MDKRREDYVKMLHQELKENVRKTTGIPVDDEMLNNFAIQIEAKCFQKNCRDWTWYTKHVTLERVKIEKHSANGTLYPMIADAIQTQKHDVVELSSDSENEPDPIQFMEEKLDREMTMMNNQIDNNQNVYPNPLDILICVQTKPCVEDVSDNDVVILE